MELAAFLLCLIFNRLLFYRLSLIVNSWLDETHKFTSHPDLLFLQSYFVVYSAVLYFSERFGCEMKVCLCQLKILCVSLAHFPNFSAAYEALRSDT
jgi:hypothetical protein